VNSTAPAAHAAANATAAIIIVEPVTRCTLKSSPPIPRADCSDRAAFAAAHFPTSL
jgi:hypothetical protein